MGNLDMKTGARRVGFDYCTILLGSKCKNT